jgi:putative MATE family efflux protein
MTDERKEPQMAGESGPDTGTQSRAQQSGRGMEGTKRAELLEGPVTATVLKLTAPMLVAMFAMVGFNIIDTYWVAQLGTEQLAAMSFTFAVVMSVQSISMGIGMGTTAVVARVIGEGDTTTVRRLTMDAILLGLVVAVSLTTIGMLTIEPLFSLLGAEGIVLEYIGEYMSIWYFGLALIVVPQVGNSSIRATGDTKTPAAIMITVLTVNMILDPLLIFGWGPFPELGLRGAALATLTAQGLALVIGLVVLRRRKLLVLIRHGVSDVLASWGRILKIGVPAGITQLITPLSTAIITSIVAGFGVAAVAGYGVATRLEMMAIIAVMALGSSLVPFLGQNWGAGLRPRVSAGVKSGLVIAGLWGVFVWLISLVGGNWVAAAFDPNPEVIEVVRSYLLIVFPSLAFQGILFVTTSALNALHKPMQSLALSVLRMFVLYVPLALAGAAYIGLLGVWWAALASNTIAAVVGVVWFRSTFRKMVIEAPPAQTDVSESATESSAVSDPAAARA